MIRFIIKVQYAREGIQRQEYYTLPLNVPELEKALRAGGYGDSSYESHELIGVEICEEVTE